jgi:hypothetical protein
VKDGERFFSGEGPHPQEESWPRSRDEPCKSYAALTGSLGGFSKGVSFASGDAEPPNLRSRDPLPAALTRTISREDFVGTFMAWGPHPTVRIVSLGPSV